MDAFKKFLKNKKVDKHFKRSGTGQRLDTGSSPLASKVSNDGSSVAHGINLDRAVAADVAAQAALKRLQKSEPQVSSSHKKIQMIAQRELEEEKRKKDPKIEMEKLGLEDRRTESGVREFEHSDVIEGVFYTCELLGDDVVMKKEELMEVIEKFLIEQLFEDDTIIPAVLLLYSLNKTHQREIAVETISKYIQNIAENPEEPKFRRIRLSNKAYQERVAAVKGGRECLAALGFNECLEPLKEGDVPELFLVMTAECAMNTPKLIESLDVLRQGQSVPIKIARNAKVFMLRENERVTVPKVSRDFYEISADEIRKEQKFKTEEVERLTSLRTREMREKDEKLRQYKYKYTLIRVRLPDCYLLQGTFGCYESLGAVRQFVHSFLLHESTPFTLRDPMNGCRLEDDERTLAEFSLAPAAVLHLEWNEDIKGPSLAENYRMSAVPLSAQ